MKTMLTPSQVARAIGVSESSVKRWCDRGEIAAQYTAGGHRRVPISAMMEFLRSGQHALVRPEEIGLPQATGRTTHRLAQAAELLRGALLAGEEIACRRLIFDLYLAGESVAAICDRVFAPTFEQIGAGWACGEAEIYQERRGCEVSLRVLLELRLAIPEPPLTAPRAAGGAPEGDRYALPTTMVELVLRRAGWRAVSLGNCLPFETLRAALSTDRPNIFWLSVSHIEELEPFLAGYNSLYQAADPGVSLIVGGRALSDAVRHEIRYTACFDNLRQLEAFVAESPTHPA